MLYAILLRLDSAGLRPLIFREDSPPLGSEKGVRYRYVAQSDDHGEALRVVELLQRRLSDAEGALLPHPASAAKRLPTPPSHPRAFPGTGLRAGPVLRFRRAGAPPSWSPA